MEVQINPPSLGEPNGSAHTGDPAISHITWDNREDLSEVLSSKTWAGRGDRPSRIIFDSPNMMLNPYIDHMESFGFGVGGLKAAVRHEGRVSNVNEDRTENVSYGRVKVEFSMPDKSFTIGDERFTQVFGVIYAFDLSKPEVIVYAGRNAAVCINLHLFSTDDLFKSDYLTGTAMALDSFRRFTDQYQASRERFEQIVTELMERRWTENQLHRNIGKMLTHVLGSNSFGTSALNHAVKLMYDASSRYTINTDGSTTAWNFLQALTQYVTDKSAVNVSAQKTLQMSNFVQGLN